MEAQRSGGGGKELLLPATRGLWNSLEDFKLQVVMMIIMRIVVIIMIMMGLVEELGGLQVAGGVDHYEDHGDHHDYDGTCGRAWRTSSCR